MFLRVFIPLSIFQFNTLDNIIQNQIREDYNKINSADKISGTDGVIIQCRTKGGKNSSTRAYYFRKQFLNYLFNFDLGIIRNRNVKEFWNKHKKNLIKSNIIEG